MAFKVITAATVEPVSIEEARPHLRLGDDETAEDEGIAAMIVTAREMAEHYTGRALCEQTLEMALDEFPCLRGPIRLDAPPVASVTSIKYTDTAGTEQPLDPATYALNTYGEAPRDVNLAYGSCWPLTRCVANAVRVRYVTGYTVDTVPRAAKSAILLLVAHLFENRSEVIANDGRAAALQIPVGAERLLDTIKVYG